MITPPLDSQEAADAAVEQHVTQHAAGADFGWVVTALQRERDAVLERWLEIVADQPFHAGHREHAVADHIPDLLDALIAFLKAHASVAIDAGAPLDDDGIRAAAERHARVRLHQGLTPVDVLTEFRLLRQETIGALRHVLPEQVPPADVLAADLLINDALDGAIAVGLRALTDLVESVREEFLATTVHDVRGPLTLIKGTAQLTARRVRRGVLSTADVVAELERIDALAERMIDLLAALTDASRIALRHLDLTMAPGDLREQLEVVAGHLGLAGTPRFRVLVPAGLTTTGVWDRQRIDQVLANLLGNALKYAPDGSPITATFAGTADWLELHLRDEGIGVTAEDLGRIFERYQRAANAVMGGIEGQGLGLYLCRGIVEAHGGRIWASSPGPGQGTTVHVVLPRRPSLSDDAPRVGTE
jgi:signal transduction histidine kinase